MMIKIIGYFPLAADSSHRIDKSGGFWPGFVNPGRAYPRYVGNTQIVETDILSCHTPDEVILLEKDRLGAEANSRAAGIIPGLLWSETGVAARKISLTLFRELSRGVRSS